MNNYSKIKFQNPIRDVRRATEGVADVTRIQGPGSAGRTRTCNQLLNRQPLYH